MSEDNYDLAIAAFEVLRNEGPMLGRIPDLLIRDFPAEDPDLLDEQVCRLGLSRVEYLRRQLHQTSRRLDSEVTVADLSGLADLIGDLGDESVTARVWS